MKEAKRALATLALAITVGCSSHLTPATPPPNEAVALHIYSTEESFPLLQILSQNFLNQFSNYSLEIAFDNQNNLLAELETGEVSYFISHHYPNETQRDYWAAPITQDAIALVVNQNNPADNLGIEDLRRIYRGYISNWKELGGEDLPITLYSRDENAGIRQEFERLVMGQERTSPNALVLPSSAAILERLSADRSAIAYLPLSQVDSSLKILAIESVLPSLSSIRENRYALRMMIYIIGLNEAEGDYLNFIAWSQSQAVQEILSPKYAPLPP